MFIFQLKRSLRISKKDNEVSTRPNVGTPKVSKQKNMIAETISGSTKKRKMIEDELITPRRSSRLMTVSPPKVKSTDARVKNTAVKKDATPKPTKKKECQEEFVFMKRSIPTRMNLLWLE